MKLRLITRRYSEAFVSYVKENIGLEKAIEEVKVLKHIIIQSPELEEILISPETTSSEKIGFIDETLKAYFSQELISFLKLLVEKRRIVLLMGILDYIRVNYSHGEAIDAVLKSVYPLDIEIIQEIKDKLEKKLGRKLHFYSDLDERLLGGVQVTVGNMIIDGSIKGRLDDLRSKVNAIRMG